MQAWAFPAVVEDVFPARLRRGPGESPMGSDPHGRLTGVSPCPHRCLTGPPSRTETCSRAATIVIRVTYRAASSSILEGVNNRIKTLTPRTYDYRDEALFILKLLPLHQAGIKLVG
jgi:hypothetical protein